MLKSFVICGTDHNCLLRFAVQRKQKVFKFPQDSRQMLRFYKWCNMKYKPLQEGMGDLIML